MIDIVLCCVIVCPTQCMALDRYKITWVYVCVSVCLSVCNTLRPRQRPQFLFDLPQIWKIDPTSDNKDQVRWPLTPEVVVSANARQFAFGLAHFRLESCMIPFVHSFSDFNQIWFIDSVCKLRRNRDWFTRMHSHLTSSFLNTNFIKLPINVGLQVKRSPDLWNYDHSLFDSHSLTW